MSAINANDLLNIWEWGRGRSPLHQALVILAAAYPEASAEQLAKLPIDQRDAHLIALREQTFGSRLQSVANCPACGEALEFELSTRDVCDPAALPPIGEAVADYRLSVGEYELQFRLPTSEDLLAVRHAQDASDQVMKTCLVKALQGEQMVEWEVLPEDVRQRFRQGLSEASPQAEIVLSLSCPACGHEWSLLFDIVSYFWREIATQAQRLMQEVHVLAMAYGWREADILAMSAVRRQAYLEMIRG